MRPGSVVIVRAGRFIEQPNLALRVFRSEAAVAVRRAKLSADEYRVILALVLAAEGWAQLPGWVRLRLGHPKR